MRAIFYGIGLQFKFDIRSKSMLITCYLVPLVFFSLWVEFLLLLM